MYAQLRPLFEKYYPQAPGIFRGWSHGFLPSTAHYGFLLHRILQRRGTRPQLHRLRSGRVLIDLVMPPVRGIQPPRPHVFIDGKRRGNVERVFRVAAGEHTVQIKGWFDRSDAVSIMVPAGELVQLEVEQTRLAYWLMAVIATSALVAFLAIPTFDLLESGVRVFFSAVAVSCAGALAISRFAPTSRLSLKRDAQ